MDAWRMWRVCGQGSALAWACAARRGGAHEGVGGRDGSVAARKRGAGGRRAVSATASVRLCPKRQDMHSRRNSARTHARTHATHAPALDGGHAGGAALSQQKGRHWVSCVQLWQRRCVCARAAPVGFFVGFVAVQQQLAAPPAAVAPGPLLAAAAVVGQHGAVGGDAHAEGLRHVAAAPRAARPHVQHQRPRLLRSRGAEHVAEEVARRRAAQRQRHSGGLL
jgi:hypothetical protein